MEKTMTFARRYKQVNFTLNRTNDNLTYFLQRQGGYKSFSLCSLRLSVKVCHGIINAASPVSYFLKQGGILCDKIIRHESVF